jgi:hypothetical protein
MPTPPRDISQYTIILLVDFLILGKLNNMRRQPGIYQKIKSVNCQAYTTEDINDAHK